MPRLVDHTQKRLEILRATWELIATRGVAAATMREIAAASGYANGALSHYFRDKQQLLEAAYVYVWEATNERIRARLPGLRGVPAIRIYCEEISPSNDRARLEAKIVLPFFAQAVSDDRLAGLTRATFDQWRAELVSHFAEARVDGTLATTLSDTVLVEQLLSMLMGLQILATLTPHVTTDSGQQHQLDAFLGLMTLGPSPT